MIQVVTIKHLSISVVFKISHNIICSILLIKFRPSQHVRLRAMRFKSRLIEGTFLRGTTFILEMKVIRGLTKYLRRVSKLLQIRRCHFDFLQGYHAFLFAMDITDLKKRSRHTQVLGFGKFISSLFGME